jgi:hypothetical protein
VKITIDLDIKQIETLNKAFTTLNRFNWTRALRAIGMVTNEEGDLLRDSLHDLADQINKKGKKIEQPTKATSTKQSE